MINRSKLRDTRQWLKWQRSGALPPPMEACPGCGILAPASNIWKQKAHMEAEHPEIIEQRLLNNGFVRDESGRWIDTLAAVG